ncbi:MAG: hypothetical protein LBP67_10995 [Bacteroidales bacterium]|nr:hypothetical protein [Bacteroidales bacterium]
MLGKHLLYAQDDLSNVQYNKCLTSFDNSTNEDRESAAYQYDPDGPVKVIRVNFHYFLKDDGTGNFNETSDNYSNRPYNGYMYADDMVKWCNSHWNRNELLQHMPNPPVPALQKKIQLQLCGVFFHRNTSAYNEYVNCSFPPDSYLENCEIISSGEVLNIFITKDGTGGCYNGRINISTGYLNYKRYIDLNDIWLCSRVSSLVNHEIGHFLGLTWHTIQDCCGNMTSNCDGIDDTPTYGWLKNNGYNDPCCWNCSSGSNNLMDYCAGQIALSPMQIFRMHERIDGIKQSYRNCKYKTQSLNITGFTTNKAYIAKYITIPSTSNIVVGNNSALFINAEEVIISGALEVQSGSVLNIETATSCN